MTTDLEPRVKEMARALARDIDGIEPDTIVYLGEPYRVRRGFITPGAGAPAWERYVDLASRLYDIASGFEA